jgi:negative regulator of sigma-B (phosphoserine phosphatase)
MTKLDYFLAKRPLINENACGDTGIIEEFDDKVFIGIIDVLGHGEEAHELAMICMDFMEKNYRQDLIETMEGLHEHIKGSRGAVAGFCLLDLKTGELEYVGLGNITARKFGSNKINIVPRSGIVGYTMSTLRKEKMKLHDGDVLILHTDGVRENFDLEDYPKLLGDNAEIIATHIINQFGRQEDDAACIALRYQK